MCVCVCVRACVRVCVWVCVRERARVCGCVMYCTCLTASLLAVLHLFHQDPIFLKSKRGIRVLLRKRGLTLNSYTLHFTYRSEHIIYHPQPLNPGFTEQRLMNSQQMRSNVNKTITMNLNPFQRIYFIFNYKIICKFQGVSI